MRKQILNNIFKGVDVEVIDDILFHSKVLNLKKGDYLTVSGNVNRNIFIILEGSILRNISNDEGSSQTVMFHTLDFLPIITSIDSYVLNSPTKYDIIANESATVLELSYTKINDFINQNHSFAIFSNNYLIKKYFAMEEFRNYRISKTPKEFLEFIYAKYPFFIQKFSSSKIANFMGITPEWLSKIKRN